MIKIRNGELILPNGYTDLYRLSNVLLRPPHEPETDNEPVVVVTSTMNPCAVPRAVMISATFNANNSFIYVFWAEDEDNGNREVLVAWDTKVAEKKDEGKRWFIVEEDRWIQAPFGMELVRLFKNNSDAIQFLNDHEFVVIPTDTVSDWKAIIVSGLGECSFSDIKDYPELIRILETPDGLEISHLLSIRDVKLGDILTNPFEPEEILDYCIECIIVTSNGEIFIAASTENGDVSKKIIGRKFTHEEARQLLSL